MKYIKISVVVVLLLCVLSVNALAFNGSTYGDMASSSTTTQNLLNFAMNFDSFKNSDYVIFQNAQYSYYIVWGDLTYNDTSVTANQINYVQYYREGSGYDYIYNYAYGTDNAFNLNVGNVVISNIEGLGMSSNLYRDYEYYQKTDLYVILFGGALLVIMILTFRSVAK